MVMDSWLPVSIILLYKLCYYISQIFFAKLGEKLKKLDRVKVSFIPTTVSVECTKNNVKFE